MSRKTMSLAVICFSMGVLLTGCAVPVRTDAPPPAAEPESSATGNRGGEGTGPREQAVEPPPPPPPEQRVTLMAVGDIMVHDEQLEGAWDPASGAYRFDPFFARVTPVFRQADWVIGNLETTLAGKDLRYTGYPRFNSPESLADALARAGFTAVTTANNHSLDRGETGVYRTIAALDQAGLAHTGTFRSADERDRPLFLEKNGIRLAIVAYTYGTNGIPVPGGKPYLVNLIRPELIERDIARARQLGADLVAVALHFGEEYQRIPNERQRLIADHCIASGADLVIGHHPHVVQPYEWRLVQTQDGRTRRGLVAYSLGNFWSAQRGDYKDVGAILSLVIRKSPAGDTAMERADWVFTYVHYFRSNGKRQYVILPLRETLAAAGNTATDPAVPAAVHRKMEQLHREIVPHIASLDEPGPAREAFAPGTPQP